MYSRKLKVNDENSSKTESINLSSFKMQHLSCDYNVQAEIRKDNSHLHNACHPTYDLTKASILFHLCVFIITVFAMVLLCYGLLCVFFIIQFAMVILFASFFVSMLSLNTRQLR